MPEGHTLHRLARDLRRAFGGRQVRASSLQQRFAAAAATLDGCTLAGTEAYGKHLFVRFTGPAGADGRRRARHLLHVHLGLYGSFRFGGTPPPPPRGELRLRLESAEAWADLRGPTASELILPIEKDVIEARLGPDPLRADAVPDEAWARIVRSAAPIGGLLMNQQVISGIGNVFRAEALFRHRVNPYRPGRHLDRATWDAMWIDLVGLLRAGVRAGRIVTTLPEHRGRRSGRALQDDAFYVYRRTGLPCRICGTPISSDVLQTRNLFWCSNCQDQ